MKEFTQEDFITCSPYDEQYAKKMYRNYKKLDPDKVKILLDNIGETVLYRRGKKEIKMKLVHIPTSIERTHDRYDSYPYDVRLNYLEDPKGYKRYSEGFWTYNIDKISIIEK